MNPINTTVPTAMVPSLNVGLALLHCGQGSYFALRRVPPAEGCTSVEELGTNPSPLSFFIAFVGCLNEFGDPEVFIFHEL